jgi:hypothetical protein
MTATEIITKIVGPLEPDATPLMSNTPPSLLIECQTIRGPQYIRLTKEAALELEAALATYNRSQLTGLPIV